MTKSCTKCKQTALRLGALVLFAVCVQTIRAQGIAVTGRVSGENTEMSGATVLEKGTQNAVLADSNGNYAIKTIGPNPVLVFSYLGYITQEIDLRGRKGNLDVVLFPEVATIDQLVVVGYGTQRRVSVVGAQSAVSGKELRMPAANLSNAISGRLAGVVAVTRSGEPGHDSSDIWIRGMTSEAFGQSSKPLILVDGVERGMNDIDAEDIESIDVLKDASATAVYGVRGGHGVVLITTKPGKAGKPRFSFDYYEGFTRMTQMPKMADGWTYMNAANEALHNVKPNEKPIYSPEYIVATKKAYGILPNDNTRMYNQYLYPAVDWMKEIFKQWGHNRRANVNIRGGLPSANYYVSLTYFGETGLTRNFELENYNTKMKYDRFNFTSNLNLRPTRTTKIDLGFSGYVSTGHYPQQKSEDLYKAAMQINPVYLPAVMPDGSVSGISDKGDYRNPLMDLARRGFYRELGATVNSNIRVTQDLGFWGWSEGLSATALVAFDNYNRRKVKYDRWDDLFYFAGAKDPETGLWIEDTMFDSEGKLRTENKSKFDDDHVLKFDQTSKTERTAYVEASLNYDRSFGKHRVGALLLFNQRIRQEVDNNLKDGKDLSKDLVYSLPYKSRGYAARMTYSWADRYLLEANLGINGSENFNPENRYGIFPAVGAGWVISNEPFWKSLSPVVSYFKVRYTLGFVGGDTVTERRFMYEPVTGDMYGLREGSDMNLTSGWGIKKYGVNVGWSRSRKQDLGVDLYMFSDKLQITLDLFQEHQDRNFLRRQILPDYAGFVEEPWANLGVVDNKGIEAALEYSHSFNKNIALTVRGNFTYNISTIVEDDSPAGRYQWLEKRGTPVNATWGYIADGLFTSQEEIDSHATQFGKLHLGDIKYRDLNNDGRIDDDDKTVIGRGDVPRIYYGFGFDLKLHNFSIGALFQGTAMADRQIKGRGIHPFSGSTGIDNLFANIADRWSADDPYNTNVFYPRLNYQSESHVNNSKESTWWQKDMSFLRLKQLTVSYFLPKRWMDRCFLSGASVYVMGSNLLTFSKFKLWDPELNTDNGTKYPNMQNISIGVKFNF